MKKEGFTLVELLGTIVILIVVVLIAVGGYGKVRESVKRKSYENLVSYVEMKACDYANDTGNLITNIDELVKNGYIEADNEKGEVISPIDGKVMNCYIVSVNKEEGSCYGKISEEEECDIENIKIKNQDLGIHIYKTKDNITKGERIEENTWSNENVILEAYVGEKIKASEIKKIIWSSNTEREEKEINGDFENKNSHIVKAEQIINTSYKVTIEMIDETKYETEVKIKIDKQRPIIQEVYIEKENEYTSNDKEITITATDGNGSGIKGYYVGENKKCKEVEYEEKESNRYETRKEEGTYYICVKDKAGNVSEEESTRKIEVKYVDKNPPEIKVKKNPLTLGNGEYAFKENVEVKWGNQGEGEISCNPSISKKSGVYQVTCTAIGKNGLTTSKTFEVKHNYPAVANTCTRREARCGRECGSWGETTCETNEGTKSCTYCKWYKTVCDGKKYGYDVVEYTCYKCPYGGTLNSSNNICYY